MVSTVFSSDSTLRLRVLGEKRVAFYALNWQSYQQILQALGENRSSARITYDRGTLEITMPLEDHEFIRELIGRFIYFLIVEFGMRVKTMGSTTLDRADLDRGAEPDNAYYIQNYAQVAGKIIDLSCDPAPDLVVEVDITHTDINKLVLYASMGVSEFWRYDGKFLRIYQLQEGKYQEVAVSPTFPRVPKARLYEFLEQARQDEVEAEITLRAWVRQL